MSDRLHTSSNISLKEHRERQFRYDRARIRAVEARARLTKLLRRIAELDPAQGGRTIAIDQAEVARAKARRDIAAAELARLTIRAPDDGTIMKVGVRRGEVVEPATPGQLWLRPATALHLRIELDELDLHRFRSDQPAAAHLRGQKELVHDLRFVRIEPVVTPKKTLESRLGGRIDSRALNVLYEIDGERLLPGQLLDVFIGQSCADTRAPPKIVAQTKKAG